MPSDGRKSEKKTADSVFFFDRGKSLSVFFFPIGVFFFFSLVAHSSTFVRFSLLTRASYKKNVQTGSDATLGMCSACFREHQKANASSGAVAPPVSTTTTSSSGVVADTAAAVAAAAATAAPPAASDEGNNNNGGEFAVIAPPEVAMGEAAAEQTAEGDAAAAVVTTIADEAAAVVSEKKDDDDAAAAPKASEAAAAAASPSLVSAPAAAAAEAAPPSRPVQPPGRCFCCRKKVGLAARFSCRCGYEFCSTHRLAEDHECTFDWKGAGREALAKANPLVQASKIDKI